MRQPGPPLTVRTAGAGASVLIPCGPGRAVDLIVELRRPRNRSAGRGEHRPLGMSLEASTGAGVRYRVGHIAVVVAGRSHGFWIARDIHAVCSAFLASLIVLVLYPWLRGSAFVVEAPCCIMFGGSASLRESSIESGVSAESGDVGGREEHVFQGQGPAFSAPAEDQSTPSDGKSSGKGRAVWSPYGSRADFGAFALYQGNWGGSRADRPLQAHIVEDVVASNPCCLVCAQEVDHRMAQAFRDHAPPVPAVAGSLAGNAPAVAGSIEGIDASDGLCTGWLVATGHEACKTCMVAAKRPMFRRLEVLEWHKSKDGSYKNSRGYRCESFSRVLIVEAQFRERRCGMEAVRLAVVHMHHLTAKLAPGHRDSNKRFWAGLFHAMIRTRVDFLAGDFNVSLRQVAIKAEEYNVPCALVTFFAWRHVGGATAALAEEPEDDENTEGAGASSSAPAVAGSGSLSSAPAVAGSSTAVGQCMSDSCGVFVMKKVKKLRSFHGPSSFSPDSMKITSFSKGSGFPLTSYVGGEAAMRRTFDITEKCIAKDENPLQPTLFACQSKQVIFDRFDPQDRLFRTGAHAPLMISYGTLGGRSDERLVAREQNMIRRGYGPGSANRAWAMQQLGHAPKPDKGRGKHGPKGWEHDAAGKGFGKGKGQDFGKGKGAGKSKDFGKVTYTGTIHEKGDEAGKGTDFGKGKDIGASHDTGHGTGSGAGAADIVQGPISGKGWSFRRDY